MSVKRIFLLFYTVFFLGFSAPWLMSVNASTTDTVDVSNCIVNAGFEQQLVGWVNNGYEAQNVNNATASQGWSKVGDYYADKWHSAPTAIDDAEIYQNLAGLSTGFYVVKALLLAVNQSGTPATTKGTFFYAGLDSIPVNQGKDYSVTAVVTDGTLRIGVRNVNTDANWVAMDSFRIYRTEGTLDEWRNYLHLVETDVTSDTLRTARKQNFFNKSDFDSAFLIAAKADSSADRQAMVSAIVSLTAASQKLDSINARYDGFRTEIESLENAIPSSIPEKDSLEAVVEEMTEIYNSPEDYYDEIPNLILRIQKVKRSVYSFSTLYVAILNARNQLLRTNYSGRENLESAIATAEHVLYSSGNAKERKTAESTLTAAMQTYICNRPSEWITIKNGNIWLDSNGDTIQAHAPGFLRIGAIWYMIGEDRSHTSYPDVNMYSTVDFKTWKFERKIIENGVTSDALGTTRMIERPKLMYNALTGKFTVWCHWEKSDYSASEAAALECDSVNGPYRLIWSGRPLGIKSRDCNVFVDQDSTAYFISTTDENANLGLFKLSEDYLSPVEHTTLLEGEYREAPALVRIGNRYHMISSSCTGWNPNKCMLTNTSDLTTGWTALEGIGNKIAFDTQAAAILTIAGTKDTTYLYVGDRWKDPDLPSSKTIIFPISFKGDSCIFEYHQKFDINLLTGEWRETPDDSTRIPKDNWKVVDVSSQELSSDSCPASNAIDGNIQTIWHTLWSSSGATAPHYITVDMGKLYNVDGFIAIPRQDNSANGIIRSYEFQVSEDSVNWTTVSQGNWLPYWGEVDFDPIDARYFKLICNNAEYMPAKDMVITTTMASLAEIDLLTHGSHREDTGVSEQEENLAVQSCKYYTLGGVQVTNPVGRGIYITRQTYVDGSTKSKVVVHP